MGVEGKYLPDSGEIAEPPWSAGTTLGLSGAEILMAGHVKVHMFWDPLIFWRAPFGMCQSWRPQTGMYPGWP